MSIATDALDVQLKSITIVNKDMFGIENLQHSTIPRSLSSPVIAYGNYFNRARTRFLRDDAAGEDERSIEPSPGCCYVCAPCGGIELGKHFIGFIVSFLGGATCFLAAAIPFACKQSAESSLSNQEENIEIGISAILQLQTLHC